MGCFMNVLWLVLGGVFTAIEYVISSLLLMVTIVGIPFGMQTLKLAGLALWPFGTLDSVGRHLDCCIPLDFWSYSLHHSRWYSFRIAAFQTGRTGSDTFWKGYC